MTNLEFCLRIKRKANIRHELKNNLKRQTIETLLMLQRSVRMNGKAQKGATMTSCCAMFRILESNPSSLKDFPGPTSKPPQYATSEDAFSGAVIKREKKRLWQVYYFQRPEEMEPLLRSPLQKIDVSSPSEVLNAPKMYRRLWLSLIPPLTLHWGVRK